MFACGCACAQDCVCLRTTTRSLLACAVVLQERESIEEEKAQVDRYKQLLLKQRDIMILLTQRLNERDDQIVALQVLAPLTLLP